MCIDIVVCFFSFYGCKNTNFFGIGSFLKKKEAGPNLSGIFGWMGGHQFQLKLVLFIASLSGNIPMRHAITALRWQFVFD